MNPKTLDASHRCVLENWETIDAMIACRGQVENYLHEIAGRVLRTISAQQTTPFKADNSAHKGWIQLNAEFSKTLFVGLGVEGISIREVLFPQVDAVCRAFVFTGHGNEINSEGHQKHSEAILKATQPPEGFERDDVKEGYLFVKTMPAITKAEFADPKQLEGYFTTGLATLLDWWKANHEAVSQALK